MRPPLQSTLATLAFRLIIVMQLCMLPGCATLPDYRPKTPVASDIGRTLLDEWLTRSLQAHALQGVAKVRVQTPERSLSGTQVLLAEEPDRLRAETLSPFGTPLLILTANDAELAVLVPGDNAFYRGRATPENLGRFTRLPLRLADLVGILLFRPPTIDYHNLETAQLSEGGWMVTLESGQRRQELLFDVGHRLTEVRYLHNDELQLQLAYSEFDATPRFFPRRIELALPQQRIKVKMDFRELDTNRQFSPGIFTLSPPPGATVTILDEVAVSQTPSQSESR
ncbi:MAG: DUF4292 domain-containing protein [Desulfuromonas sp.]|nr:DUF4292 domain-containing protein [Desulfuromonas sp.]